VRRAALIASLVALVTAPPAPAVPRTLEANLDGDRALERVLVRGKPFVAQRIVLEDRCGGTTVRHRLSRVWHSVDRVAVLDLDGVTRRPEIFFDMRNGAGGHVGVVKVVHFHRLARGACPVPVTLFRYSPDRPPVRPPAGYGAVNFLVTPEDYARRYRGKELRLDEGLFGPNDQALCCPSRQRRTFLRYAPSRERYVVYSTRLFSSALAG
jgi:hypothetical protein